MKKFLLLIELLSIFILNVAAQGNFLTGVVKNLENRETLPAAMVLIKGTSIGTTTNVDGFFTLLDLPSQQFTLNIFYMGYHPLELEVDLTKVKGRLVFEMRPSNVEIDEVIVSGKSYKMIKATEGVSAIHVAPVDLKSLPSFGEVDIFRSLQLLPGISGTNENSSGLYVRGGTPDQNLVLLDGMTVYNVDHFFGFFSAFNADAIKDIQLYKGGFPAKYGGRIASVVDLTGKSGDPNHFHMNGGARLLDAHTVIEMPFKNKGSILFSVRRSYTDFLESNMYKKIYDMLSNNSTSQSTQNVGEKAQDKQSGNGQPTVNVVRPDFYFYDLNGKITYRPTENENVSLSIYSGKDNMYKNSENNRDIVFDNEQMSNRTVINSQTETTDWGNMGLSLKWSRQWSPKLYSNLMGAYSNYFSNYNQIAINQTKDANADTLIDGRTTGDLEENDVKDISFRLDNEWQFSRDHRIGFGLNLSNVKTSYNFVRDDTLKVLYRKESGLLTSIYLQDIWKITPELEINAGMRTNWYDVTRKIYIEPRLSFKYTPTSYLALKGATGKYNQYVNRIINENVTEGSRDFWLVADNDLVNVQSSWHYILGASLENKNILFDVEAYYKTLSGLSEFSLRYSRNNIELDKLFFQGDGTAKGIEFLLQKKLGEITGWVTYTLSKVEHQFDGLNNGNPFPALHDQTHEFKFVSNWEPSKNWRFSATWVYGSGKPYTSPETRYQIDLLDGSQFSYIGVGQKNGERLPAYHRMDVAVHYLFKIKKVDMDAGFSIFNLYNRTNVWYRQFNLQQLPIVVNDVTYLGVTPNASLNFSF